MALFFINHFYFEFGCRDILRVLRNSANEQTGIFYHKLKLRKDNKQWITSILKNAVKNETDLFAR